MQKLCISGSIKLYTYIAKCYEKQLQQFKGKRQGEFSKQSPSGASVLSDTISTVGVIGQIDFGGLGKTALGIKSC